MKKVYFLGFAVALFAMFLVSCGDSHRDVSDRSIVFDNQDFPLKSGNRWIYEYVDSINNIEKSFQLFISGSDLLSNRHTLPCRTAYSTEEYFDELPIVRTPDSLIIPFFDLAIRTPLKVGATWDNELLNTNSHIVTSDYCEVIDGYSNFYQNNRTYSNVQVIKRKKSYKDKVTQERFVFESYTFIAKDVGVITYIQQRRSIDGNSQVLQSQRYTLKSYTL